MPMELSSIVLAMIAGAGYGVLFFFKSQQSSEDTFDYSKLGATVLLAALIGAALGAVGNPVTQATIDLQIAAYVGYIAVLETMLKLIWRRLYTPQG